MLSNHMLLDLYALFVSVRRNPLLLPADAYQEIAEMLDTSFDHNAIRVVLRKYIPAEQTPPELNFIDTDNKYYTAFWCKDKETAALYAGCCCTSSSLRRRGKRRKSRILRMRFTFCRS